jgi:hypothetical protein
MDPDMDEATMGRADVPRVPAVGGGLLVERARGRVAAHALYGEKDYLLREDTRIAGSVVPACRPSGPLPWRCAGNDLDFTVAGGDESMSRMPFYDFGALGLPAR